MKAFRAGLLGALAAAGVCPQTARAEAPAPATFDAAMQEADRRFVEGDLTGALGVLEPACAHADRPECAFSLGAVHHALGHCGEALAHYRRYRVLAPRGEHIEEVSAALEEVESRCGDAGDDPAVGTSTPALAGEPDALLATSADGGAGQGLAAPERTLASKIMTGSFVLSGATAVTSVVFAVLAARSAGHCDRADVYDQGFIDECERKGPSYNGLWQGFALASGGFLGIGLTLWWLDSSSSVSVGASEAGMPTLNYQRSF